MNGLLRPLDFGDQEYSWIDRNAISFRIQDGSGSAPTFTAYTDCDVIQSVVRTYLQNFARPNGIFTWIERLTLISIGFSQQGKAQRRLHDL